MKAQAAQLKLFFSGFSLPAYARQSIPDTVTLPYIAYDLIEPRWDQQANMSCQVYYPKEQLEELLTKADEIKAAIGQGKQITLTNGYLMIYLDNVQDQTLTDEYSQSAYISLIINAYHLPGE